MSRLDVLQRGRARAVEGMTETIRAGRLLDGVDPDTGDATQEIAEPYTYEGIAQVKYPGTAVSNREAASQAITVQTIVVKTPIGAAVIPEGQCVEVVSSTADESLVGRTYRVDGAPTSGQATAHRYSVIELP